MVKGEQRRGAQERAGKLAAIGRCDVSRLSVWSDDTRSENDLIKNYRSLIKFLNPSELDFLSKITELYVMSSK